MFIREPSALSPKAGERSSRVLLDGAELNRSGRRETSVICACRVRA
ncbi:hypothetical protein [Streptomyces murinus]|nr:hypothetical protein [Streptomyces murinus]